MARKPQRKLAPGKLDELLKRNSISKAELARALDVEPSNVTRWWKGTTAPEYEIAVRMARILNTTLAELYGGNPDVARDRLADELETEVGEPEAEIVRSLAVLSPERRKVIAGYVRGWIDNEPKAGKKKARVTPNFDEPSEESGGQASGARLAPDVDLSKPALRLPQQDDQNLKPQR